MRSSGWSAVSYADLAVRVGIRTASIHHHFPSNTDLGQALIERYTANFERELDHIRTQTGDPAEHLAAYFRVVHNAMGDGSAMCLCARLAADYMSLPISMRHLVTEFNQMNIDWFTDVLRDGVERGVFRPIDDLAGEAQSIYAQSQGAQLVARSYVDVTRFDAVMDCLMSGLTSGMSRAELSLKRRRKRAV